MAAILYIFLFQFFYPFLLKYQSGMQAARVIPERNRHLPVAAYASFSYSFEFYSPGEVKLIKNSESLDDFIDDAPVTSTTAAVTDSLIRSGVGAEVRAATEHFHITRLKYGFLDQAKDLKPLNRDICSTSAIEPAWMANRPLTSVVVPVGVPFTSTFTPGMPSPFHL